MVPYYSVTLNNICIVNIYKIELQTLSFSNVQNSGIFEKFKYIACRQFCLLFIVIASCSTTQ